ncbi:hypothetical protein P12x_001008 [Tundrisphaera lichenicola]|uniref:hypothetical protein n=1 Tax=Tundrisphaera lichenicola TaxID=2029860 RepID=UPI003EBE06B6
MSDLRTRRGLFLAQTPPSAPVRGKSLLGKDRTSPGWTAWLADPRSAVLFFLASALIFGGGRKLLQGARTRRAIAALDGPDPSPEEVESAGEHGRAGIIDLFRLLGTAEKPEVRDAAGRGLARLWAGDDLIVEEEKALVRRGFVVTWRARRRYPRAMKRPIPIEATFGVPFLVEGGPGVSPANLEWSYKILGAEQARLEEYSDWRAGAGLAAFRVEPGDYPTDGPHRLALASKVRVVGLTDTWELELPHIPFSFEFDSNLAVDALLTMPDDTRGEAIARVVRLEANEAGSPGTTFLDLGGELVLREPPDLVLTTPIPSDLAHRMSIEFEGIPGTFPAGTVIVSGQGSSDSSETHRFPIGPVVGIPPRAIDRPGERKIRAILTADPDLGWADPDVRSLWPGEIVTDWVTVRVIRK